MILVILANTLLSLSLHVFIFNEMVNSFSTLRDSLKLVLKYLKHGTSRACNVSFFLLLLKSLVSYSLKKKRRRRRRSYLKHDVLNCFSHFIFYLTIAGMEKMHTQEGDYFLCLKEYLYFSPHIYVSFVPFFQYMEK